MKSLFRSNNEDCWGKEEFLLAKNKILDIQKLYISLTKIILQKKKFQHFVQLSNGLLTRPTRPISFLYKLELYPFGLLEERKSNTNEI